MTTLLSDPRPRLGLHSAHGLDASVSFAYLISHLGEVSPADLEQIDNVSEAERSALMARVAELERPAADVADLFDALDHIPGADEREVAR